MSRREAFGNLRLRTFSVTLAILATGMVAFGLSRSVPVALVALFVAGLGYLMTVAGTTTAIQQPSVDASVDPSASPAPPHASSERRCASGVPRVYHN